MKKFLKKIITFGFVILFSVTILTVANKVLISMIKPLKFSNSKNILILGDSRTKYAFNDKLWANAINMSTDADSYFYSYLKLKNIHKRNSSIDTLLLSFSYHNINKSIEDKWLLNDFHISNRIKMYFPFFDIEDFNFLLSQKPTKIFSGAFKQCLAIRHILLGSNGYGGYSDLKHNRLDEAIEKSKKKDEIQFEEAEVEKIFIRFQV